jgi:hypothetical protein
LRPSGVERVDGKGGVGEDEEAATRHAGAVEVVGGGGDGEGLGEQDVAEGGVETAEATGVVSNVAPSAGMY